MSGRAQSHLHVFNACTQVFSNSLRLGSVEPVARNRFGAGRATTNSRLQVSAAAAFVIASLGGGGDAPPAFGQLPCDSPNERMWPFAPAQGQVKSFVENYSGFAAAAGPLRAIDFETLPDGSPSGNSVDITPEFNYSVQGAYFTSPLPRLAIAGNPLSDHGLRALTSFPPTSRNWIDVDMTIETYAVGAFFGGNTEMFLIDSDGSQIARLFVNASGSGQFIGAVSDVPIASVRFDSGTNLEDIDAFVFGPVPEPATASLLVLGLAPAAIRRSAARDLRLEISPGRSPAHRPSPFKGRVG